MAPLLHKHQILQSSISWKCLCKNVCALCTGGANWVSGSTCQRWYSGDVELENGGGGEICSIGTPTADLVERTAEKLRSVSGDRFDTCSEPVRRKSREILVRKASLGSLSSGGFSSLQQEVFFTAQPLRRCASGFHTSRDYGEENSDSSPSQAESSLKQMQESSPAAEEPMAAAPIVKHVVDVLNSGGWEQLLEQDAVQFNTFLVCEVIRRQANVNRAFQFFNWVKERRGVQHSGRTYKVMLHKLMSHRDFKNRKLDILRQVIDESLADGYSPGVTIHTYMIDGYCQVGAMQEALEHFNLMERHGCSPNVVTYSALINGFIRVGRVADALKVLDEMETKRCEPNVVTYSALIHGLVKDRRLREAWTLFEKMKARGCLPNLITYSCLIDGLAKAGQFEDIYNLLDEMRLAGCTPNSFIYGTLINNFVKVGMLDRAWDLFGRMKQDGLTPNLFVFTPFVSSLGKAGDWEQAQVLLAEMRASGCPPDVVTYSALIAGLVKAGKWDEACKVLDEMEKYNCDPNEITYSALIAGLVKVGLREKAEALLEQMVSKGCKPSALLRDAVRKRHEVDPATI